MYRACIAIVDATRARLFQFERTSTPEGLHDQLTEVTDLVNPTRRLRPSELFSDSGPGGGHSGYNFDDHREEHVTQIDAEFAGSIAVELARLVTGVDRMIVCASPRMLGQLREVTKKLHRPGLIVDELPRDLVKLTPPQLREQLASYGLLPASLARLPLEGPAVNGA
jgi:protein required for attachment to host cells